MATAKDDAPPDFTTSTRTTRSTALKSSSVWETRIKHDQVKGGVKVFNPHNSPPDDAHHTTNTQLNNQLLDNKKLTPKRDTPALSAKRKTWKSDTTDSTSLQIARHRSELNAEGHELNAHNKNQLELRKTRSVARSGDGTAKSPLLLRKLKSDSVVGVDNDDKKLGDINEIGKSLVPVGMKNSTSNEEFGVCQDKSMNTENVDRIEARLDSNVVVVDGKNGGGLDEVEIEKKSVGEDVKEVDLQEQKPSRTLVEKKKWVQSNERPVPFSSVKKQQPAPAPAPVVNNTRVNPAPTKTKPNSENFHQRSPTTHGRLQSFVDLVMWRDMSRSAFVFGLGTFVIISSSFTKDLNISFISVVSYLGLVYLASIFLFRTFVKRSCNDIRKTDQDYVVGEEEAIWLVKLILPYINEFLLNLRALFSGDPATTMKLAVLLFVLARCGGSITIWKMSKLGFFGVFTIPRICSAYSSQLTAYGKFWIRRFEDAWESCSHKKAVGFAIFTLVWNLSSVVARIWAVFMLFVAFKYYQQSSITEGSLHEEATTDGSSWRSGQNVGGRRRTTSTESHKQKKPY